MHQETIDLLKSLIAVPAVSREEGARADLLETWLTNRGIPVRRLGNNLWSYNGHYDPLKPTVLLCSHIDTVPPNEGYGRDPYRPEIINGKLYGLGSNDAGGSLVCLIQVFRRFFDRRGLPANLCLLLSAEEEVSGENGVRSVLDVLGKIDLGIVGEPTGMRLAVAERGLMVLDCRTQGVPGHAAHGNTVNPIAAALPDLQWFAGYRFPKTSERLGTVKMNVTVIRSGEKHNVVPAECRFTVDVRSNDRYTNEEILEIVRGQVACEVTPRSTRLNASGLRPGHPLAACAEKAGFELFGSATLSDQALMPFDTVKIGPGDSLRSHTADEYIELREIEEGYDRYLFLLNEYFKLK